MELVFARNIHEGKQDPNGDYIILHETMTAHMKCLEKTPWGYTVVTADKPGDACELCTE
jgi:hypothetical protein